MNKWIIVNHELPKEYDNYLATLSDKDVTVVTFVPHNTLGLISGWSTCYANGFTRLNDDEVIAWMPLPKPYKD